MVGGKKDLVAAGAGPAQGVVAKHPPGGLPEGPAGLMRAVRMESAECRAQRAPARGQELPGCGGGQGRENDRQGPFSRARLQEADRGESRRHGEKSHSGLTQRQGRRRQNAEQECGAPCGGRKASGAGEDAEAAEQSQGHLLAVDDGVDEAVGADHPPLGHAAQGGLADPIGRHDRQRGGQGLHHGSVRLENGRRHEEPQRPDPVEVLERVAQGRMRVHCEHGRGQSRRGVEGHGENGGVGIPGLAEAAALTARSQEEGRGERAECQVRRGQRHRQHERGQSQGRGDGSQGTHG